MRCFLGTIAHRSTGRVRLCMNRDASTLVCRSWLSSGINAVFSECVDIISQAECSGVQGCAWSEYPGVCYSTLGKYYSGNCPYNSTAVCDEWYFCDESSPYRNEDACEELLSSYCCSRDAWEDQNLLGVESARDPRCSNFTTECAGLSFYHLCQCCRI